MGIFKDDPAAQIFSRYRATIQWRDKLLGGTPADAKLLEYHLIRSGSLIPGTEQARLRLKEGLESIGYDTSQALSYEDLLRLAPPAMMEKNMNVFKRDEEGLFIEGRTLKSCLKEAIAVMFPYQDIHWGAGKKPTKAPRNYASEMFVVDPDRIHLGVDEADGHVVKVAHTNGPSGSNSHITKVEFVHRPTAEVEITVVKAGERHLNDAAWKVIWNYAEEFGWGSARSQGYGRFDVIGWEKIV